MTTNKVTQIKRCADSIRQAMTGKHYYDEIYGDLTVADLLLVLEDENYHTEETLVEALVTLHYEKILEACKIEVEHDMHGHLTEELCERRRKLDKEISEV